MNKEKLLTLINNPKSISQFDLGELEQLVDQYPYFQIGHALIAKTKTDNRTLDYRNKIHLAAITTADRNVLKTLIRNQLFNQADTSVSADSVASESTAISPEPETLEDTSAAETVAADQTMTEKPEWKEEIADKVTEPTMEEMTGLKVEQESADENINKEATKAGIETKEAGTFEKAETPEDKEEALPLGDLGIKKSSDTDKTKLSITDDTKKEDDSKDNLYKELEENLRSLQQSKAKTAHEAEKTEPPKKKTTTASASTTNKKSTTTKASSTKSAPAKTSAKTATERSSRTSTKTTTSKSTTTRTSAKTTSASTRKTAATKTGTTKKAATKTQTGTAKKTAASTKATTQKAASKTSTAKAKPASVKKTETSKKKLQKTVEKDQDKASKKKDKNFGRNENMHKQTEIIEEFIKKEPTISKPKSVKGQDNIPQEDLSLKSVEIKEDLISENLAIIMEKQGKIQKAKDIYKKLIWKFPQKKAYFASRIEELERS